MKVIIKGPDDIEILNDDGTKFAFPIRSFKLDLEAQQIPILHLTCEIYGLSGQPGLDLEILDFDLAKEVGNKLTARGVV